MVSFFYLNKKKNMTQKTGTEKHSTKKGNTDRKRTHIQQKS
jgi:hypothetical protein